MSSPTGEANGTSETDSLAASSTSGSTATPTPAGGVNVIPTAPRHPTDPLSRDYDPTKDNLSIEELLARPRLPRSPFEHDQKKAYAVNTLNIKKPVKSEEERAAEFEREKEKVKTLGEEVSKLEIKKKVDGESEFWSLDI